MSTGVHPQPSRREQRRHAKEIRWQRRVDRWEERRAGPPPPRRAHRAIVLVIMMLALVVILALLALGPTR